MSGSWRLVPTFVLSGHALHSSYKDFLSGNSFITTSAGYVTVGTGYTPI